MSIVFNCLSSKAKGGLEQMFINYALVLSKKYTVICIVPEEFKYFDELKSNNIQFETIKVRNYCDLIASVNFIKLYKKNKPQFVFSHNGRFNSVIQISNFFSTIKNTIGVCHGDIKRLDSFSKILTVNAVLEKSLSKKGNNNISVLPNFIKLQKTKKCKFQLNKKTFTFGTISRLSPEKSVIDAIKALMILFQDKNISCRLKIAGTGPEIEMLMRYVDEQNLKEIIDFCGWVSDKSIFYKNIDCFVLPSRFEPFGLTILEAFNYSLPVISTNTDGPNEIINDGINGLIYDSGNYSQLVELMMKVANDPIQASKIGTAGLNTLQEKYSQAKFESSLFQLLSETMDK